MGVLHIGSNEFNETIKEGLVLVDFYADWCGPCKMLAPVLEQFSNDNNDVKVIKVNVDEASDLAEKYRIMSIPTLLLFKNGELDSVKQGFNTKPMLESWINERK
jgi:thioredoxin 1